MTRENGFLVISLDFELLWGVFDVIDYEKKFQVFLNTRKVIPEMLQLFTQNKISCTWATVGMLFNKDWDEWQFNIPQHKPTYSNPALSAYEFGNKIKASKTEALCFAPDLILKIANEQGQEIGTHTYSHYYCLEQGQNSLQFQSDLEKAVEVAKEKNIFLKSLIFPRNQFNQNYFEICQNFKMRNVRTNPYSWYWKNLLSNSIIHKLARSGDAYIPFGKKSYFMKSLSYSESINKQRASRFLRPVENNLMLRKLKLKRIADEMEVAAKTGEVYHLWWHPHNFGYLPEKSIQDLSFLIKHFVDLQKKYNYRSVNMSEMGNIMMGEN